MALRHSTKNVSTITNKNVFFDANVIIYIFWPTAGQIWQKYYSSTFARLLQQQNKLYLDFTTISEVINRVFRIEYENHLKRNQIDSRNLKFKDYRNSSDGKSILEDIFIIINDDILDKFQVIGKSYTIQDIQSFLVVDSLDFNDKGIVLICKENNCILLTNDLDFKNSDIEILTANSKILST